MTIPHSPAPTIYEATANNQEPLSLPCSTIMNQQLLVTNQPFPIMLQLAAPRILLCSALVGALDRGVAIDAFTSLDHEQGWMADRECGWGMFSLCTGDQLFGW